MAQLLSTPPARSQLRHTALMHFSEATSAPVRLARLVVLAILIGIGISHVIFAVRDWALHDMDVYLAAAARLRDGQPLYVAGDVAVNSFWYAPWYAVLWIPATFLSREVVAIGWSVALVAGTGAIVILLARRGAWGVVLAVLVGPPLFAVSAGGNVHSLMVLGLLAGFHRSWGPAAVAVAASMKFTPILLVAAYIARREWWKAAASLGLTIVLTTPSFLMGITQAGIESSAAPSLLGVLPIAFGIVVGAALVVVFRVQQRHALLAAAAAAVLALPRLFVYDITLAAVGAAEKPATAADDRPSRVADQ